MPYNNNTPLANNSIASTQVPINNNFAFIQTDLQVDHKFNGNGPVSAPEGSHLQAQMPGQALLTGALPSGINGTYYVDTNGFSRFYDGTTNWVLDVWNSVSSGTINLNTSPSTISVNSHSIGVAYFYASSIGSPSFSVIQQINFFTDGTKTYVNTLRSDTQNSGFVVVAGDSNILALAVTTTNSSFNGSYKYLIYSRPGLI